MTKMRWKPGNRFRLLENGEAFFPAVFGAIESARHEVLVETFILFQDKVGWALHAVLLAAAQRGVQIDVTVDGYGSPDLTADYIGALTAAGVRFHLFDPRARLLGLRTNLFRRMHRKLVVVDGARAFVGGINYSADHLADFGPQAKQDYAVDVEGPIVEDIHRFAREAIEPAQHAHRWFRRHRPAAPAPAPQRHVGQAEAIFVTRDNHEHRTDIERHYRIAMRSARNEVIVANAYFFPGYRLLRDMRRAARRGVHVCLILQGQPDMPIVKFAAGMLYDHLLRAGVHIYEYCERPLHGKVATADDTWSTVGSSNLDPLSLALNLEANVVIRDRAFNRELRESLSRLMRDSCTQVDAQRTTTRAWWWLAASYLAFHVLRRFPAWAGWLPAHKPRLHPASAFVAAPTTTEASVDATAPAAEEANREAWHWRGGADRVSERQPDYSVS